MAHQLTVGFHHNVCLYSERKFPKHEAEKKQSEENMKEMKAKMIVMQRKLESQKENKEATKKSKSGESEVKIKKLSHSYSSVSKKFKPTTSIIHNSPVLFHNVILLKLG